MPAFSSFPGSAMSRVREFAAVSCGHSPGLVTLLQTNDCFATERRSGQALRAPQAPCGEHGGQAVALAGVQAVAA